MHSKNLTSNQILESQNVIILLYASVSFLAIKDVGVEPKTLAHGGDEIIKVSNPKCLKEFE